MTDIGGADIQADLQDYLNVKGINTLFIKIDSASSRYWKSLENDIKAKGMPSSK